MVHDNQLEKLHQDFPLLAFYTPRNKRTKKKRHSIDCGRSLANARYASSSSANGSEKLFKRKLLLQSQFLKHSHMGFGGTRVRVYLFSDMLMYCKIDQAAQATVVTSVVDDKRAKCEAKFIVFSNQMEVLTKEDSSKTRAKTNSNSSALLFGLEKSNKKTDLVEGKRRNGARRVGKKTHRMHEQSAR